MRFVMIGGFLGAGKTTTIARLAAHYQQQGKRVGIVTNDQAADLVDTHLLRSQGFQVGEVAGACFCCHFDDLTKTVAELGTGDVPDVILAEPVGSCTDLVATVVRPLEQFHGDDYEIAPYGVILKPSHGLRILRNEERGGFSPDAAYIFRKQLEEADFIVLNRIDELTPDAIDELDRLLSEQYPAAPAIHVSAKTGANFDQLIRILEQETPAGRKHMDVDYDVYADGEAELGWLNSRLEVRARTPFSLDDWLVTLLGRLAASFERLQAETAHLKVIGTTGEDYGVANLVSNTSPVTLSSPAGVETERASIIINARVALAPAELHDAVTQAVETICEGFEAQASWQETSAFRPGRPVPTHRSP